MISTSGRPWPGPAGSFSCHWSSPFTATTVSPEESRPGGDGSAPAFGAASSRRTLRGVGLRFLGLPSCPAGTGTSFLEIECAKALPAPCALREVLGDKALFPEPLQRVCSVSEARSARTCRDTRQMPARRGPLCPWVKCPGGLSQNHDQFEVRPWPSSREPPTLLWVPCKGGTGSGLQAPCFRPRL